MYDCLKNSHGLKFIWLDTSKRLILPTDLYFIGVQKQKIVYCTCKWQKNAKKGYFGPFLKKFRNLCSFHRQICSRHISGPTITGLPGVILVKTAYYTTKWPKTSKKGYFRRFFEIFPFDEISTIGSVKDTCLGIQSWGSQTMTLQSE